MYKRIPLFAVADDHLVLMDGYLVYGWQLRVFPYEGIETEDLEREIANFAVFLGNLEKGTGGSIFVSCILDISELKDSDMSGYLDYHKDNVLNAAVAADRVERYKKKVKRKLYLVIAVPMFSSRSEFQKALKKGVDVSYRKALESAALIGQQVARFYKENYSYEALKMSGTDMWKHLFSMINPHQVVPEPVYPEDSEFPDSVPTLREQLFVSDFVDPDSMEDSYLRCNGGMHSILSLDMLPDDISSGGCPPGVGSKIMSKIMFPCRVTVTVEVMNQVWATKHLERLRKSAITFVFHRKPSIESERNRVKAETIKNLLSDMASDNLKVARLSYQIALYDTSEQSLQNKQREIIDVFMTELKGSVLFVEQFKKQRAFVSSLGYFPSYSHNRKWTTTLAAANMVPLRGAYDGTDDEPLMLFGNRWNSVTAFNPFSQRQNKWSFCVIAPSGQGKSFFVNMMVAHLQSLNPVTCIFDLAPLSSYLSSVEDYGGQYCEVNPSAVVPQVVNPFDFKLGFDFPPDGKLVFLEKVASILLSDKQNPLLKEELDVVRKAIRRTYERFLIEEKKKIKDSDSNYAGYGDYVTMRDAMLEKALENKENPEIRDSYVDIASYAHRMAMPSLSDLATTFALDDTVNATTYEREITSKLRRRLLLYTDGVARKVIGNNTNFDITKDFIVINLGFLKDLPDLLIPAYITYREFIWEKLAVYLHDVPGIMREIYGDEHFLKLQRRPKILLTDEFHNLNASSCREVIELVNKDARQSRTYGVAIGVVTQSLKDIFYESADEKFSIFEQMANKIFLRHTSAENPQQAAVEYVCSRTGMGKEDRRLFESLKRVPSEYVEAFVFSEDIGKGVIRIEPTASEMWRFSTDKRERYIRDMLIQKLMESEGISRSRATSIVISVLAKEFPSGLAFSTQENIESSIYNLFDICCRVYRR